MEPLYNWQYATIALAAFFAGLGKGGLPGIGNLTVVLLALVLPVKASVGILLPILLAADIVAVIVYRRHAEWKFIARLAPWVLVGIVGGYLVFGFVDDRQVALLIGSILLAMTAFHFLRKAIQRRESGVGGGRHRSFAAIMGVTAGFATMVANAAGPVASLYLIASGLPKYAFIGTAAWFFFIVNLVKVPLMIDIGIINGDSLALSASFMVFAAFGAIVAPFFVRWLDERIFQGLVWFFVVVGGLKLIIP